VVIEKDEIPVIPEKGKGGKGQGRKGGTIHQKGWQQEGEGKTRFIDWGKGMKF